MTMQQQHQLLCLPLPPTSRSVSFTTRVTRAKRLKIAAEFVSGVAFTWSHWSHTFPTAALVAAATSPVTNNALASSAHCSPSFCAAWGVPATGGASECVGMRVLCVRVRLCMWCSKGVGRSVEEGSVVDMLPHNEQGVFPAVLLSCSRKHHKARLSFQHTAFNPSLSVCPAPSVCA